MTASLRAVTLVSPAKINLFLEILGRRPDGYHTISTLFQEISLSDALRVRAGSTDRMTLATDFPGLKTDDSNLVLRAAREFKEQFPKTPGLSFFLKKRIPIGAGLGGGSSNAAKALDASWSFLMGGPRKGKVSLEDSNSRIRFQMLLPLAKRLGADVPFFLQGGLASAGGVGERLTFYPPTPGRTYTFVLVFPRVFSSTPVAYRALQFPLTKRRSRHKLTRALRDGAAPRIWSGWLFNRLEEVVLPRLPLVAHAKKALLQAGCLNALMSGSGSSVFGVVNSPAQGRRVLHQLRREAWDFWLVSSVSGNENSGSSFNKADQHGNHGNPSFAPR